nr:MAG TPA: hypothetical protein [Caudoviricetes sp.]
MIHILGHAVRFPIGLLTAMLCRDVRPALFVLNLRLYALFLCFHQLT